MEREEFERVIEEVFASLPEMFRKTIDNVRIVVEDVPAAHRRGGTRSGTLLLGLYEGVPLSRRDTSYGMYPVVPDTITLFHKNIEMVAATESDLRDKIREVLIHEIGHYYGMTEEQIRRAGY